MGSVRGKQSATNHLVQLQVTQTLFWLLHIIITMSVLFEPSLSTSAMRAPLSTADAPSMADTLPAIAFGFDDLRERMARFTDRFDEFIAKGRKQVLEERNKFRINVAELQGKHTPSPHLTRFGVYRGTNELTMDGYVQRTSEQSRKKLRSSLRDSHSMRLPCRRKKRRRRR